MFFVVSNFRVCKGFIRQLDELTDDIKALFRFEKDGMLGYTIRFVAAATHTVAFSSHYG